MTLYTREDLDSYAYLSKKYWEAANAAEKLMQAGTDGVELKYTLKQVDLIKGMINDLGLDVPDDKAKELGFLEGTKGNE